MERKYKISTVILSAVLVLFIVISSIILIHEKNNDTQVLTDDEMEDLYNQIAVELDFDRLIAENEKLRKYNSELLNELELYEELHLQPPHESYRECLEDLDDGYYRNYTVESLDYIVNQVETRTQNDKTIYHFIIVIYSPDFSIMDLWDCYTVYEDDYFMYENCNLIKTKGE